MNNQPFRGVLAPVLTPFTADLTPDVSRFTSFCHWLLAQGADGLALFGTTSEANSQSSDQRMALLDSLIDSGVPGAKLMPGTGACSIDEAVRLNKHAVGHGCGGVLMLPPFFYKGVSDDGLFAFFSEIVQRVGNDALNIYLYHIPPQTGTPFSLDLIERLIKEYPSTIVGLKDSGGDWANTKAVLDEFPGFGTFAGSEVFLLDTLRGGGVCCITATGNVNPTGIRKVYENWETPEADALQAAITKTRNTIQSHTLVPALKAIISHYHNDAKWGRLMPPMVALSAEEQNRLIADLDADEGFSIASPALENAAE